WRLVKEKAAALRELVAEQLARGHIVPATSPWNTPVFVIKKKNGRWHLLHDLRRINAVIEDMGPLQPGMPSPAMIPANWNVTIIDLRDCFFTIPLATEAAFQFAFSVPTENCKKPMQRYHWTVVPQGMKNSPTICQQYVATALAPIRRQYLQLLCYHYMDHILLAGKPTKDLTSIAQEVIKSLKNYGLQIAEEKVQQAAPWKYLEWKIMEHTIQPQTVQLQTNISTLNDLQKLLGNINWIRTVIGINNQVLAPLFDLL
ncbi:hypothetical protein N322_00491, partial [Cariama cristata]